jgi:hypothetical protein
MQIPFNYLTYPLYMRRQIDPVFVINVFLGCKSCSSFMDIFNLRVPSPNLRGFPFFHVSTSFRRRLSARGATPTNSVFTDLDIFGRQISILRLYSLFSICVLCLFCLNSFCMCLVNCSLLFVLLRCADDSAR